MRTFGSGVEMLLSMYLFLSVLFFCAEVYFRIGGASSDRA